MLSVNLRVRWDRLQLKDCLFGGSEADKVCESKYLTDYRGL